MLLKIKQYICTYLHGVLQAKIAEAEIIPEKPDTDNTGVGMHGLIVISPTASVLFYSIRYIKALFLLPLLCGTGGKAFYILYLLNKWNWRKTTILG